MSRYDNDAVFTEFCDMAVLILADGRARCTVEMAESCEIIVPQMVMRNWQFTRRDELRMIGIEVTQPRGHTQSSYWQLTTSGS